MPTHQVDHPLEQLRFVADTATNDDAFPRPGTEGRRHDGFNIVGPIKAEEAELSPQTVLDEAGPPDLDAVGHRPGVPRPWHAIRIEPDHEHTGA